MNNDDDLKEKLQELITDSDCFNFTENEKLTILDVCYSVDKLRETLTNFNSHLSHLICKKNFLCQCNLEKMITEIEKINQQIIDSINNLS